MDLHLNIILRIFNYNEKELQFLSCFINFVKKLQNMKNVLHSLRHVTIIL